MIKTKMSKQNLDLILNNEREWRKYMLERMDNLDDKQQEMLNNMTILKFKVGLISSGFGLGAAILVSFLQKKLGL